MFLINLLLLIYYYYLKIIFVIAVVFLSFYIVFHIFSFPLFSFCIVLVTKESEEHDLHRTSFRNFAQSSRAPPSRVKFVYIYEEKQSKFIGALLKGNKTRQESVLEVNLTW